MGRGHDSQGQRLGPYWTRDQTERAERRRQANLTQGELAQLAVVSERTVRNWETGAHATTHSARRAIEAALEGRGRAALPALPVLAIARTGKDALARTALPVPRRAPVKYRNQATGDTWSGRGLKPKWLTVALARGSALASFEVEAKANSALPVRVATTSGKAGARK